MKTRILLIGLIVPQIACFAQDNPVTQEKRTWGVTRFVTREKFQPFEVDDISQGSEHLVGSGVLQREEKGRGQLVIQGHLNRIGELRQMSRSR